jgi:hypothetical protein
MVIQQWSAYRWLHQEGITLTTRQDEIRFGDWVEVPSSRQIGRSSQYDENARRIPVELAFN